MDPVSVVSGIGAVLRLTGDVMKFISRVKDAPAICSKILLEISSIHGILPSLIGLIDEAESGEAWLATVRSLGGPNGPLEQSKAALERITIYIEPLATSKRTGRRFIWPFKEDEESVSGDENDLAIVRRRVSSGFAKLQLDRKRQEDRDVVAWLSPLSFWAKQNDVFSRRKDGTGEWLLESKLFRAWLDGTEKILWCPGMPGAGKTILASVIIDYLEQTIDDNAALAYIYCNYKERNQTAVNIVANLLQQLVQKTPVISDDIIAIYRRHNPKQTRPSLAEYSELLQAEIYRFSKVFIIIDALDECSEREGVRGFIPEVRKLLPNIHLLVTSRPIALIEDMFEDAAHLEIRATDEDVKSYVEGRIEELPKLVRYIRVDPTFRSTILDTIVQRADGMFLLAQLHMDSLAKEDNRRGVRRALENLPTELNMTYNEAVRRIHDQDYHRAKRAEQVLSWISYAHRELTVKEIQYAIAVEPEDTDMDEEALPDEDILVSVCAGLVTIDKERSVICLVHQTVQEYLERTRIDLFPAAEANIAQTCLTYLLFNTFDNGYCPSDIETEKRLRENPLLHYAANYWGYHVRTGAEKDRNIQELVLNFLKQEQKVSCSTQVQHIVLCQFEGNTLQFPRDVSSLQVAASFGLLEIAKLLVQSGVDIMARDSEGTTALHSAASKGYGEVVEFLLKTGADPNAKDNNGMTALHWAASNGHEAVVQALLEGVADIAAMSCSGETALHQASWNGHTAVVRQLLERGAEPNSRNRQYGGTPLQSAAWFGHEAVMRVLLEHGADPNLKEKEYGQTPLGSAVIRRQDNAVKLLLSQGSTKADTKDAYGRTPLWWAARKGYVAIVCLLLERDDVNPASTDVWGKKPLFRAIEHGHDAVIRVLAPLSPGHPVSYHSPPLLRAAQDGDVSAVRLLLERNESSPDIRSSTGQTPLSLAARNGHVDVVRLLLEQDGVDLESKCMAGRTPLSWAAGKGRGAVVKLLLRKGADPNSKSDTGRSPLWLAAADGYEEVVLLLLEHDSIDVESACSEYSVRPLMMAVEYGHETVVRLLLEKGANVEAQDAKGRTALRTAASYRHEMIMHMLKSSVRSN